MSVGLQDIWDKLLEIHGDLVKIDGRVSVLEKKETERDTGVKDRKRAIFTAVVSAVAIAIASVLAGCLASRLGVHLGVIQ